MATDFDLSTAFIPSLHKPSSLLPIARHRQSLLYLIETFPVTIVVGQTGSGKTTQIPQFLEKAGWCEEGKVVAVTQVGEFENPSMTISKYRLVTMTASARGCHYCCYQGGRGDWI
jgi:predicted ATPase